MKSSFEHSAPALPAIRAAVGRTSGNHQEAFRLHVSRQLARRQGVVARLNVPPATDLTNLRLFKSRPATLKSARRALRAAEMAAWEGADQRFARQLLRREVSNAAHTSHGESFFFGLFVLVASVGIAFGLSDSFRAVMNWERIAAAIARLLA